MTDHIKAFINRLQLTMTDPDAFNEYAGDHPNNVIRRQNLDLYLHTMHEQQPDTLLVMEAPGYRGCRLTGVPVTSRKILLEGLPELALFGQEQGYQDVDEPGFERVYGEQSATIVWSTLTDLNVKPLIWNTFPFHPHKPDQPLTNRKPRKSETILGATFLHELITLFQPDQIVAVGNVAHKTLTRLGYETIKVRHPAQGGKNDFVDGLSAIFQDEG